MSAAGPLDVRIFPDLPALSRAAADLLLSLADSAVDAHGRFAVALSGGSTPEQLYRSLAGSPFRESLPWRQTHLFWSDERCVPADQPESNYRLAAGTFLSHVPLPPENVHRIRGEEGPDAAAGSYERDLRNFFGPVPLPRFDLVLLGAGADGHTASLFPGSAALLEKNRWAAPLHLDPPLISRVTLTLPVLKNAAHVLFLAAGPGKSRIVHEIIEDGNPNRRPAGLVRPANGSLTWMVDREAGAALTGLLMQRR